MKGEAGKIFDNLTDRPVAYYPAFARIAGGVAAGVLLSQIIFWAKSMRWREFWKRDEDLRLETGISKHELLTGKKRLHQKGLVIISRKSMPARTYYNVEREAICRALGELPETLPLFPEKRESSFPDSGNQESLKPGSTIPEKRESTSENTKRTHKDVRAEFEEDWEKYPRKAGDKQKALRAYKKTVGGDPGKRRQFLEKMQRYVESVEDPQFLKYAETFFRNWENLQVDSVKDGSTEPTEQERAAWEARRRRAHEELNEKMGVG